MAKLMDSRESIDPSIFPGIASIKSRVYYPVEGPRDEDPNKLSRPTKRQYFHNSSQVASCNSDRPILQEDRKKTERERERKNTEEGWRKRGRRNEERDEKGWILKNCPSPSRLHSLSTASLPGTLHELHSAAPFNSTSFQNLGFHTRRRRVETRVAAGGAVKSFECGKGRTQPVAQ